MSNTTTNLETKSAIIKRMCDKKYKYFHNVQFKNNVKNVDWEVDQFSGTLHLSKFNEYNFLILGNCFSEIPWRGNSRYSSYISRDSGVGMLKQIDKDPSNFENCNLGVIINATGLDVKTINNKMFVHLDVSGPYDGYVNGGTTAALLIELRKAGVDLSDVRVKVTVRVPVVNISEEERTDICVALNTASKQEFFGIGEMEGANEVLKFYSKEYSDLIEWKPGEGYAEKRESKSMTPYHLVNIMTALTPLAALPKKKRGGNGGYIPNKKPYPYNAANTLRDNYKIFVDNYRKGDLKFYNMMLPYLPKLCRLYDHIIATYGKIPNRYVNTFSKSNISWKYSPLTREVLDRRCGNTFVMMALCALSENFEYNKETGEITEKVDFIKLYDKCRNSLWKVMNDANKWLKSSGELAKGRNAEPVWNDLYAVVDNAIAEMTE